MTKRVKYAINKKYAGNHGELLLLYDDGTWEKIFDYQWTDHDNRKIFNANTLNYRTREEAIELLDKAYYKGELQGVFTG